MFQKEISCDIEPDFSEHKSKKTKSRILEFIDGSDVYDTSSGSFSHLLSHKSSIPAKFQYKEPPTPEILDDMIGFNEALLDKIRLAFKPATLDFSEQQ